jgi:hypothetical protein
MIVMPTAVCWLSTATIFRPPSILRNVICPLATRPKSRIGTRFQPTSLPPMPPLRELSRRRRNAV